MDETVAPGSVIPNFPWSYSSAPSLTGKASQYFLKGAYATICIWKLIYMTLNQGGKLFMFVSD